MTARAALLRSPLEFTPWGQRSELSDLSLEALRQAATMFGKWMQEGSQ